MWAQYLIVNIVVFLLETSEGVPGMLTGVLHGIAPQAPGSRLARILRCLQTHCSQHGTIKSNICFLSLR